MADFLGMMKQAAQLQSKMQAMQEELGHVEVEGISGGGLVAVRMTAKFEVKSVKIDPSLIKPDEGEILEDLLVTAHNDARRKAEAAMQEKMASLTGGLGLPPGLGPRSARRAALHLIKKREALMAPLSSALQVAIDKVQVCKTCGNIDTQNPCTVCTDPRRDPSVIVVVADVADLWALERANAINGLYHVLGATLSPLDGVGPADLTIDALVARAHDPRVNEVILALNATVDGQTTAHYITDLLQEANVKVTRLAHGVPVGGELDYLDEGTLSAAMRQRTLF
jgi:recombination protein RecR